MPLRIMIVEDETTIALLIEDMLEELGHVVAGTAMRLQPALAMAERITCDLAILDVNLDGERSFPIADVLNARRVPVMFATGYGAAGPTNDYAGSVVIQKPFLRQDLARAISAATGADE